MYFLPRLEVTGNHPVWSLKTFPLISIVLNDTTFARTSSSAGDIVMTRGSLGVIVGVVGFDVLRRCCQI